MLHPPNPLLLCTPMHIMNIDVPAGVGAPPLDTQLQATCMDVLSPNSWRIVVHIQSTLLYALKASVTADCDISHYLLACFILSSLCKNRRIKSLIACKGTNYVCAEILGSIVLLHINLQTSWAQKADSLSIQLNAKNEASKLPQSVHFVTRWSVHYPGERASP